MREHGTDSAGWLTRPRSATWSPSTVKPTTPAKGASAARQARPDLHRQGDQLGRLPPEEAVVVVLGVGPAGGQRGLGHELGIVEVAHVEHRDLGPGAPALLGGVLADAQQSAVAQGVEVGRVAEDLQLAPAAGGGRVGQVDRVQRVGLAERHHVADLADEAHAVDALASAEPADLAHLGQLAVLLGQHGDEALRRRLRGRPGVAEPGTVVIGTTGPPQDGPSVVATRRLPWCSDIEKSFMRWPRTPPEAR